MLGSIHLLPDPKAQVGRPVDLGMLSPIVGGESKGLEEGGKSRIGKTMPPRDLSPSEDQHPMAEHRASQNGKRGEKDMTRAAE